MTQVSLLKVLTCWLRPARTAPELAGLRLRWAYLIHILSVMIIVLAVLTMIDIYLEQESVFEEIAHEFASNTDKALLVAVTSTLGIELAFIGLALVVLPWGAGDERLRSSWAHALRFTWLHTTHTLPLVLVIGALTTHWNIAWDNAFQEAWDGPFPGGFWVEHGPEILVNIGIAASFWILWTLFRAVGARRVIPAASRPPTCEFCGYNLTGTAMGSRCSECGTPLIESLGPTARAGTVCELGGGWPARLLCGVAAILRPQRVGRQIQLTTQPARHRRCLWLPLLTAFVAVAFAVPMGYVISEELNPLKHAPVVVTAVAPLVAAIAMTWLLAAAMLVAAAVGMIQGVMNRRNLLPAAMQMVSHLGLLLTAWGLFSGGWFVLTFVGVKHRLFVSIARELAVDDDLLVMASLLLPQFVWPVILSVLVWKGTTAARYANR